MIGARRSERPLHAHVEVPGIHVLFEGAWADLNGSSCDPAEVAGSVQVDTERVVGIQCRDRNRVRESAGAGIRADENGLGRGLVPRYAIVEQALGVEIDAVADIAATIRSKAGGSAG